MTGTTGRSRPLILAAVLACASGCAPELDDDPLPAVVEAEFDPSAEPSALVPKPTDLVYDADLGTIAIEIDPDDSAIQAEVSAFFNELDGWPASMAATAEFLGDVDPATISDETVVVLDITDPADPSPVPDVVRSLGEDMRSLTVHPGVLPTWEVGRRYAIAIIGGPDGVLGVGGEQVVPSPAFWFFRAADPLVECDDYEALAGCRSSTALLGDQDATDLEEVRLGSAEVFDALALAGHDRGSISLAWSFRTSTRTVVPFDPSTDDVHFPNDYYRSEDDTRMDLPSPEGTTVAAQAILDRLDLEDGFSLTAGMTIRFVGSLNGSGVNLSPMSLLLVNADDTMDLPFATRTWDEGRGEVHVDPIHSLHPGTRYAAVPLGSIDDVDGNSIISSHIWAILRSENPVADAGGSSLIEGVSDEDAGELEEARLEYVEFFDTLLSTLSFPREFIRLGIVFTTMDPAAGMRDLREIPWDESLPTAVESPLGLQDPVDVVPAGYATSNILGVALGTMPALDAIDPATREIGGSPRTVDLPFVLALPILPPSGRTSVPIAIVQHDLGGSKIDAFAIADDLAAEGWATIAVDLPGHGDRGVCLSDADCDAGACSAGACTGGALVVGTDGLPLNSSRVLFPVDAPFALADVMWQQALDLVALARSLAAVDGPGSLFVTALDAADISFVGNGLGASAGSIFMAVDPTVHVAVLSGPAGNLAAVASSSSSFPGALGSWIGDDLGVAPDTRAWGLMRYSWSWAADPGDGAAYARYLVTAPLPDPDSGDPMDPRALLVQVAGLDEVVPVESQEFFWRSVGNEFYPEIFDAGEHGMLLDPASAAGAEARAQAVTFVASGGATIVPVGG